MTDPIPEVPVAAAPRRLWDRVSVVWAVPVGALAIALVVAWQSWTDAGPVIRIEFEDAEGISARETELRFRDVTVGLVESVQFTEGLERVVATVRLDPAVAPYVDADAQFWVVRPEITTQRITGLQTVLSGVFIEGLWDAVPGEPRARFEGAATAPLLAAGEEGLRFTLRSTDGTLTSSMPLLYQGVVVGQVAEPRVAADGVSVEAEAVVFAPYDAFVTEATKFWDASGFRISLAAAGADVDFDSLSALLMGGLAFDTFVSGARAAQDGDVFRAYYDEGLARDSLFADPDSPSLDLMAVFDADFAGLGVGAPVEVEGLRVGEVTGVDALLDPARFGDEAIHLQATFALQPSRLGLEGEGGRDAIEDWLTARVAEGFRARLATAGLLGGLKVQLVQVPDAPEAIIDLAALPFPALPTAPADIADIAATAEGVVARIDALPIEQLLDSAIGLMDNAALLVGSADAQAVPGEVNALLGDLRGLTASPEVQALPAQVAATLAEAGAAVADVRAVLAQVEEARAVERVLAAVDQAGLALTQVGAATAGVPQLVDRLTATAARAEAVDLQALVAEVTALSADARALVGSPGVQALPGRLDALGAEATGALAEARAALAQVDVAALGTRLDATLASAERAVASVEASVEGVPALVARLDALAAKANGLPLEDLVAEVAALAASAEALVAAPGTQALPEGLSAALAEAEALLREAREGGVVANANATLAAARDAAAALPALVSRAGGLLDQAATTLAGFDASSGVVREAEAAIRDVAAAAEAVADLARAIERDPNSLIFGD